MEQSSQTLAIGSELHHYQIQSILGEGGFGITYKAYNTRIKQTVAIKEYLPSDLAFRESTTTQVYARSGGKQEEFAYGLKKFLEEAQTLAQFNHPNIVRAYDFFEENGTGYLVMEYADGQSLGELIKAGGALSEDRITTYFLPLLEGLAEVHGAGLLHRDIKPDNIYIRSNGNSLLIDFGAARQAVGQHSKSVTGIVSQGYAPTEQYGTNSKKQGPWTDIYAIGATLYKCITAETPIDAPTRRDDIHDGDIDPLKSALEVGRGRYSELLLSAIDQCLQVGIKQRPQSVSELNSLLLNRDQVQSTSQREGAATRKVDRQEAGFRQSNNDKNGQTRKVEKEEAGFNQKITPPRAGSKWQYVLVLLVFSVIGYTASYFLYTKRLQHLDEIDALYMAEIAKFNSEPELRRARQITPLLYQMNDAYSVLTTQEAPIGCSIWVSCSSRWPTTEKVAALTEYLERSDVPIADKARRMLGAWRLEAELDVPGSGRVSGNPAGQ